MWKKQLHVFDSEEPAAKSQKATKSKENDGGADNYDENALDDFLPFDIIDETCS